MDINQIYKNIKNHNDDCEYYVPKSGGYFTSTRDYGHCPFCVYMYILCGRLSESDNDVCDEDDMTVRESKTYNDFKNMYESIKESGEPISGKMKQIVKRFG